MQNLLQANARNLGHHELRSIAAVTRVSALTCTLRTSVMSTRRSPRVGASSVGLQLLLKSAHLAIRLAAAQVAGGCVPPGEARLNLYGVVLAELMQPAPAVLHVRGCCCCARPRMFTSATVQLPPTRGSG